MSVIAQIFLKLLTPKDVLIEMHNRDFFWKPFGIERVNESQKLLKSAKKYFYPTFSSFWPKLSLRKLFLIRSEIFALLINTLTANYEYSDSNRENLPLQIQIKVSKKSWGLLPYVFEIFRIRIKFSMFWKILSTIGQMIVKLLTQEDVLI